jgi:hypothetical protein
MQNRTILISLITLLSYVLMYFCCYQKQLKDKHAAYLEVSRLEKFFHELSLCEEKIFLKRYELREVCQRTYDPLVKVYNSANGTC